MAAFSLICACLPAVPVGQAAQLRPKTIAAWEQYVQSTEARFLQEARGSGNFLWVDGSPERLKEVRAGQVLTEPWSEKNPVSVPDGLVHDWIGAIFLPGATLQQTLAVIQDYDHHKDFYQPEVMDSHLLSRRGNDFHYSRLRLLKKGFISAVLNTVFDAQFVQLDPNRWYCRTVSTHIGELENAGKPGQRELPEGTGQGYLWRLNAYWKFQQRDGGVYVECEALSLTRSIPLGLGWMVGPLTRALPQESLTATLRDTRAAVRRGNSSAAK